jgi:hypothetical protein
MQNRTGAHHPILIEDETCLLTGLVVDMVVQLCRALSVKFRLQRCSQKKKEQIDVSHAWEGHGCQPAGQAEGKQMEG